MLSCLNGDEAVSRRVEAAKMEKGNGGTRNGEKSWDRAIKPCLLENSINSTDKKPHAFQRAP
jgi:hypothetical protein